MPVGGSRHYDGGGLGQEGGWKCPSCGDENQGPIAAGLCDLRRGEARAPHRPGRRHPGATQAPRPPPSPPSQDDAEQLGPFDRWALAHPEATLEEAFTAGYIEGVPRHAAAAARRAADRPAARSAGQGRRAPSSPRWATSRDQVLRGAAAGSRERRVVQRRRSRPSFTNSPRQERSFMADTAASHLHRHADPRRARRRQDVAARDLRRATSGRPTSGCCCSTPGTAGRSRPTCRS